MRTVLPATLTFLTSSALALAQPYDFTAVTNLLNAELPRLQGDVAVVINQDGHEIYRFQAGSIGYDSKVHLASFTKTISAAVVLSVADDNLLRLNERLGSAFPLFQSNGIGDATVIDCFGMRHGIETPIAYEIDRRYTLAQSVLLIGSTGVQAFPAGTELSYDGPGMQAVGRLCEVRTGQSWQALAAARIFGPCDMPQADYLEFDPNPAIAGGARSSASETMNFAQMIMGQGVFNGQRVLSAGAVERLFSNATRNLPVRNSPFPPAHPKYPYGVDPDYGFGDWVLAQNPETLHVEEVVGAGAWGSFIWLDRRRGLSAVLIADVPAGTQASVDAALGMFDLARREIESRQATAIQATVEGLDRRLTWTPVAGSTGTRVYGSNLPIRDLFDLRRAVVLGETAANSALVTPYPYHAVTAIYGTFENCGLVPRSNSLGDTAPCPADFSGDGAVDGEDVLTFFAAWDQADPTADLNLDGGVDGDDVIDFFTRWDAGC